MTKEETIAELRKRGIEFNPNSQPQTLEKLLAAAVGEPEQTGQLDLEPKQNSVEPAQQANPLMNVLEGVMKSLEVLNSRLDKLEGKQSQAFKTDVKEEDVKRADESKIGLDPKIIAIVEETLGTDFRIAVDTYPDKPGYLFTVIVPERLSDVHQDSRPVKDPVTGQYKKDDNGNNVMEQYFPEDRRSRAIGSMASYEVIRDHCDKVRSYIVAYYQKIKSPLPEFKVKG